MNVSLLFKKSLQTPFNTNYFLKHTLHNNTTLIHQRQLVPSTSNSCHYEVYQLNYLLKDDRLQKKIGTARLYANPPFSQIDHEIEKLIKTTNSTLVLVAPNWQSKSCY